jgi:hypothetical protein
VVLAEQIADHAVQRVQRQPPQFLQGGRLPWFEDLRARAEHAAADALGLQLELQATLVQVRHRWGQADTRSSGEDRGGQAAGRPGDDKATPL